MSKYSNHSELQEQISRYLSGAMSDKERHEFEKRALNDPFLSDALDGYEGFDSEDIKNDIEDLTSSFENKRNHTPFFVAAASIVLLIAISFFIWSSMLKEEKEQLIGQNFEEQVGEAAEKEQEDLPVEDVPVKNMPVEEEPVREEPEIDPEVSEKATNTESILEKKKLLRDQKSVNTEVADSNTDRAAGAEQHSISSARQEYSNEDEVAGSRSTRKQSNYSSAHSLADVQEEVKTPQVSKTKTMSSQEAIDSEDALYSTAYRDDKGLISYLKSEIGREDYPQEDFDCYITFDEQGKIISIRIEGPINDRYKTFISDLIRDYKDFKPFDPNDADSSYFIKVKIQY